MLGSWELFIALELKAPFECNMQPKEPQSGCKDCAKALFLSWVGNLSFAAMAVIAINTRLVVPGRLDGIGWFTLETVQRMVSAHPEHDFHLIFDRNPPADLFPGKNVTVHWVWPPARRPFLVNWWMDRSIPRLLKKIQADLFLSPDGFLSRKTRVPQVAVQHDLNFEHHPEWLPASVSKHYRWRFPDAAQRAVRLATVSQFSAKDISERYSIPADRIDVVYNGAATAYHQPLGVNPKQAAAAIRRRMTGGQPFFVFVGTQHPRKNLEGLLKAFQSYREKGGTWDLLLVGTPMWRRRRFNAKDILAAAPEHVAEHVHRSGWLPQLDLAAVLAASEALVFIPWFEGFGIPLIEAFSAGTPTIHSDRTSLPEVSQGSGLAVDPSDTEAVSIAMKRMEDEPALRESLIEKGKDRADDFSWDRTAQLLWSCLVRAAKDSGMEWQDNSKVER